jgi:hypothetical protein
MMPHVSRGWWLAVAALSSPAVGCSSNTGPAAPPSSGTMVALAMAADFQRLGDSATTVHGDTESAIRFYGAAAVLRRVPAFATITIMVDSVPTTFDAVALAVDDADASVACRVPPSDDDTGAPSDCSRGMAAFTRTLFAWEPGNPAHVLQLVATADSGSIGSPGRRRAQPGDIATGDSADTPTVLEPAHLAYFDRAGVAWSGSAGYEHNAVTVGSDPCAQPSGSAVAIEAAYPVRREWGPYSMATVPCHVAMFGFVVAGTVTVPQRRWVTNSATATHTLSLVSLAIPGAYITLGAPFTDR